MGLFRFMADDPYLTLGVGRDASEEDIRRAFHRLAKENHPDLHPGNSARAERFKKVSAANDIIGDPEKRRLYDRGEIDASGEPRRGFAHPANATGRGPAPRFEDYGFNEIFSDLFNDARRAGNTTRGFATRGRDIRYTLDVEFSEAVTGVRKRVTLPEGGMLDLAVPEGVHDGQVLRLKGKGALGMSGAEPGDALVEIKVRPHPHFRRDGNDIHLEVSISIDEAILGGKVEIATISGRVQLAVPKGTSSGQVLRLKGKGVRNAATGDVGDELITVKIVLPEIIDEGLSYFFTQWRQANTYDPRKT